jgi:hypothetical protein
MRTGRFLWLPSQEYYPYLKAHLQAWANISQYTATESHSFIVEDGPKVSDAEQSVEEKGESLTGMYAPGTESFGQSRITGGAGGLRFGGTPTMFDRVEFCRCDY